ncbi:hypothetical protein [Clostridium manihotivorum]|uniref:CPBP family intramembrane metalloprotease n=1 Tax=Clostridium manihotivorum TaxID=2320868 RepID=A0A410DWJ3_9CLOT|nr:hypothetical protein [Clostridium manihotivorum]QAA33459.1 hypothetical protein C1I91_18405 [Clostridium manihotivorum]
MFGLKDLKSSAVFLKLSFYAFLGISLELLLGLIEHKIYGSKLGQFSDFQMIVHWILTCLIWGTVALSLISRAKKKYNFDIFSYRSSLPPINLIFCIVLLVLTVVVSTIDWNGFKVLKEFEKQGLIRFIFQYIYYMFETSLFLLIIVFAQKAGEICFDKKYIPWGGIFVALTWGLCHMFTKSSLSVGLLVAADGLIFGITYLLSRRNIFIAYLLLFLMFVL